MSNIKITALTNIGSNIAYTTLLPVVNMSGAPETQKANLQIIGNHILNNAGGSYFASCAKAIVAETVANAAQPNITSVGTLTSLTVTGNASLASNNFVVTANSVQLSSNVTVTGTNIITATAVKTTPTTFGLLPSASTVGAGTRAFINDSSITTFNQLAAGGGSNLMPVFSDGTNWYIG